MITRCRTFREFTSLMEMFAPSRMSRCTVFHPPRDAANSNGDRRSLSNVFMSAPSATKYSEMSGWSNIDAQCRGVIFCASTQPRHTFFSIGCMVNISLTISSAPWAQARWTGVDKSCCWVDIFAPEFMQSSTALISPPWTAECSGTLPKIFVRLLKWYKQTIMRQNFTFGIVKGNHFFTRASSGLAPLKMNEKWKSYGHNGHNSMM